ncbi:hypothetical protein [endosymbiont GvMRE of Glomus versiforme]|uniref:hypothetical protein n=1 Tax=endosymbiont GvMRE of Glomus versiforme TaxID=2039283 RepID=UPI000ED33C6E|nr:hypothetical protein [endosymbiont GvMRE of Glomus versiforme]RHZ36884.1 hypothetical protein GvMRE_I2g333 [endosymbiont GvMRE of Glomus versiforme]
MDKKANQPNKLIIIFLISTNLLLISLLALVSYIAIQSKRVLQKDLHNINKSIEKNLGNLSHLATVKENLNDLSQIGEKLDTETVKEEITKLTASISKLGKLEDIKQKLGEVGKELSQDLRNIDLSSLNNLASNLSEIKSKLKNLEEISTQLKNLSNLEGIKNNLNNLESIRDDISKIKIPGDSKEIEAIKEKLAGLEKTGQILVNEFGRRADEIICSKCHKQKVICSSVFISELDLVVKKEDWKEWVKNRELVIRYENKNLFIPGRLYGGTHHFSNLEVGNIPPEVREEINRGNYEIVLKDDSYLCPSCGRKIEKLKGLENYKDDLPKLIKELKI